MRTTVEIPGALLARAKRLARARGTSLCELMLTGLEMLVERDGENRAPFRLPDASFGDGGLVDGLDEEDWTQIRSRAYEGHG